MCCVKELATTLQSHATLSSTSSHKILYYDADVPSTAEDNMNVQLKDITVTARDGRVSHLDQVYIRGSHVRFFIVPDMLRFVFCLSFFLLAIIYFEISWLTDD